MENLKKISKLNKGICGEYAACSELLKRGYIARITEGNAKGVDIIIFKEDKTFRKIEVKTTTEKKCITGFFQKYYDKNNPNHPDYWILVHIDENLINHYYILTHNEMALVQMKKNKMTTWQKIVGVDGVLISEVKDYENRWDILL